MIGASLARPSRVNFLRFIPLCFCAFFSFTLLTKRILLQNLQSQILEKG